MKRQFLLVLSLVFFVQILWAQDPIFSQFYSAPLQLNPAFTGNTYAPRINMNYRNQWPSLNAYVTYATSYDQFFEGINSGLGLMILSDDAGEGLLKTTSVSGFYSYRLQIDRDFYMKFGVEGAWVQTRFDWDRFLFGDAIDPTVGPISPGGTPFPSEETQPDVLSKSYLDISTGILIYSPMFYGGISIKHLNTPDEGILGINNNLNTGLPVRMSVHGGMQITIKEGNNRTPSAFISPNVMYIRQGDFSQINLGAYGSLASFFLGTWFRHVISHGDAVIALAGVQTGIFKIGYSYDLTISGLSGKTGGAHEISFIINFDANRPKTIDYNDCFKIFR
ncbi:MAG TPA: type IX secretion system membrane protein PorP/SprF [Saprospiraceae bacterium]|nr:type IX secretion system membrane protein PorP/SprF [Saprospiraceae bacterium]